MLPDPSLSCGKATSFFVGRVSTMVFDGTSSAQYQSQLRLPHEGVVSYEGAEALPSEIDGWQYATHCIPGSKATPFRCGELAQPVRRRPARSPFLPACSFYTGVRLHRVRLGFGRGGLL